MPSAAADKLRSLRSWLIPPRGRRRALAVRLAVVVALLLVFRFEVLAWVIAGHNLAWKTVHRTPANHAGDVALLARLRKPGVRMLIWLGEAHALAQVNDPAMLPTLIEVAQGSAHPAAQAAALEALRNFWHAHILPTSLQALKSPDRAVRRAAVRTIEALGDERHKDALRAAQNAETDADVRREIGRAIQALLPLSATPHPPDAPRVKVAAVQFMSAFGKPEINRQRLEKCVREAAANGARIVVLPETAITGYMNYGLDTTWQVGDSELSPGLRGVAPDPVAETVPGPSTAAFCRLADELDIYLTIPFLEVDQPSGRFFNTIVLAGPDGRMLLHYRKINPWPFAERGWATRGDRGLQYIDTPYGRLGLLICYDINYEPPNLKAAKVDTLLYCIAWVDKAASPWFDAHLPRIARDNCLAIIGANWTVPRTPNWHGFGNTLILDSAGRRLARAANDVGEEIVYAELPVPVRPE